jgi:monoamine oxidase
MPNSRQWLPLTRREFLRRLSVLSGAAASASVFPALAAAPNPQRSLHVIIVGAGLAGLCAAYELERRGHSVKILEADAKRMLGCTMPVILHHEK